MKAEGNTARVGRCKLCGDRDVPVSRHHLVPRSEHDRFHGRDLWKGRFVWVCVGCHVEVHRLWTNEELALFYNRVGIIRATPQWKNYLRGRSVA